MRKVIHLIDSPISGALELIHWMGRGRGGDCFDTGWGWRSVGWGSTMGWWCNQSRIP
jgi:hypothetical protein